MSEIPNQPDPQTSNPPPGWYSDPSGKSALRWWDGAAWTEDLSTETSRSGKGLPPIGDWLTETFSTMAARAGHIFTLAIILTIIPGILTSLALWFVLKDAVLFIDETSGMRLENPVSLAVGLPAFAACVLISVFGMGAFMATVGRQGHFQLAGEPEPWSASFKGGLARTHRMLGVYLISFVCLVAVVFVATLIVGAIGPTGLLIVIVLPFVVSLVALAYFGLVHAGAALAPKGRSSFVASWRCTKGARADVLVRILVIGALAVVASFMSSMVSAGFGEAERIAPDAEMIEFEQIIGTNPASFLLAQMVGSLSGAFVAALWMIGTVGMYRQLGGKLDSAFEVLNEENSGDVVE